VKIVLLPESWRERALIVSEVDDLESWFEEVDLAQMRSFARPKRQKEWMLSRIAEKELRRRGTQGSCISFSHSGIFGAAAIDDQPVGIDVETLREISERAAHLFLKEQEIEAMRRCAIPHRMLHFWSAKEALWKQRGGSVPTLKNLLLLVAGHTENGLRFQGVETIATGDLIAALTLPTS